MAFPLRVLIVSDKVGALDSACRKLDGDQKIEIVGRAHSARDAFAAMNRLHPDVAFMELSLPRGSGAPAVDVAANDPEHRVIMLALKDRSVYHLVTGMTGWAHPIPSETFGDRALPLVARLFAADAPRGFSRGPGS
jgi:DNA-binding NarL/FixJ family response regulator